MDETPDVIAGDPLCPYPGCTVRLDEHVQHDHDDTASLRGFGVVVLLLFLVFVGLAVWAQLGGGA